MTAFKFIRPTTIADSGGSFARSTVATYFDSAGVLQTAAINVPRIGYDPVTHAHTGLIVEAAATNLLAMSADFRSVAEGGAYAQWVDSSAVNTVAMNAIGPTGAANSAATITWTGTSDTRRATVSITSNTTVTNSCYLKAGSAAYTALQSYFSGGTAKDAYAVVNWSNNTVAVAGADAAHATASIANAGNGWYRVTLAHTDTGTNTTCRFSLAATQSNGTTLVTGTVLAFGAQVEAGSAATSYIPTTSAQVTRAADVVTGSGLIYTDVPEADYPEWVSGTTYTALTSYVIRTTATTHKVYQCLVTHTTAATPEDNLTGATPKWLEVGPTNRWGMFDRKVGTVTTRASSMTYLLKPGRANSLGLLGVDAGSVEVSLIANGETVYVASIDLNSGNAVGDWYQYFYEPIYQVDAVAITNLLDAALMAIPAYGDGVLCVRFLADTGNVTCGVLALGLYAELGTTLYDPTIGIVDYSRKAVDAFGNYDILERTYSKRMSAMLKVDSTAVDNTARLLTQYRATPVVWVGADNLYSSMIVYGFCKDWEETIKGPTHSTCTIQIEGLT